MALLNRQTYRLLIRAEDVAGMRSHVLGNSAEEEICGIVAAQAGVSTAVFPGTNSLHRPDRFRMDVQEQLAILLEIDRRGWELALIYHTHPHGPAYPSATDLAEVYDANVPAMIWVPTVAGWLSKAFFLQDGQIFPLELIEFEGCFFLQGVV